MADPDEWIGTGDQQIGRRSTHARQFHTRLDYLNDRRAQKLWMQDFNAVSSAMDGI
jgi:hypothetical protein